MYKIRTYETLRRLYKNNYLRHVETRVIVRAMGKGYYKTYRALSRLEDEGIIERKSRQSGWRPCIRASAVYGKLLEAYRISHDFVPTDILTIRLNWNPRLIRAELTTLESAGLVRRCGSRGGWKPYRATRPEPAATDIILSTLRRLHTEQRDYIPTSRIAAALDVTPRHARRLLAAHEPHRVRRSSPRSGWLPA